MRIPVQRQCDGDPGAYHRNVPAVVLHRQPDCPLRRAADHRHGRADRAWMCRRQPGGRRLHEFPRRQCPRRPGLELHVCRRLDTPDADLRAGRACQSAGEP